MAQLLDGKSIAAKIKHSVSDEINQLSIVPILAVVLATDEASTVSYVNSLVKAGEEVGIKVNVVKPADETLESTVAKLAEDPSIHGIIIQTPVEDGFNLVAAQSLIPPVKDVDGASPLSAGQLTTGEQAFAPATAAAVIEILQASGVEVAGVQATVIGRSNVVGKPVAQLLLNLNASVSICHSKTPDISIYTKPADILVVAAGRANLINQTHVSDKTVVIDVGTNFSDDGKMVGDVDFVAVEPIVKAITPVPGGVGPVTTAILLRQTLQAYKLQNK